jgi:hypothetical protein
MSKQLLIEKSDGTLQHIYCNEIFDVVPSPDEERQASKIVLNYGGHIELSSQQSVTPILQWLEDNDIFM